MSLPTGYLKDLSLALGDQRVAKVLHDALNAAGADGTGEFTTLTADGIVADSMATSDATPYVRFYEEEGVAYFVLAADGDTTWEVYADPATGGVLTETITCATGKYEKNLTDNLANAYSVKINSGNTFVTYCSTNNVAGAAGEYMQLGGSATGVIWRRVESIPDATTSEAVGVYDSGKVYVQLDADENVTFQLPATQNGLIYTFVCGNAGGEINISPNAADKITGKGIAGVDDQDIQNTNGTNAVGDCITLIGDGADGWIVINMLGTWAVV